MKIADIKSLVAFNGIQSKKLFRGAQFHSVVISIENGKEMKAHSSATDVLGYIISGQIELQIEKNTLSLKTGDAFFIPANAIHALQALQDTSFLLVR